MIILLLGVYLTANYFANRLKPIIKAELKDLVLNATDSLYSVEFSDLSLNLLTKGASLTDVKFIPDTNVFKRLIALKRAPNNVYYIRLKTLSIKNFHPKNLFKFKKLNVELLLFDNPDVVMVNTQFDFNENKPSYLQKSPYDYISKYLQELRVNEISFRNVKFKYINNNGKVPEIDSVDKLNVNLKGWLIDKESDKDPTRLYALQNVMINLNDYSYATPDSLYHVNWEHFNFSSASGKLNITNFKVTPRLSEMNFAKTAGYSKERYQISMRKIDLEGINFPLYIKKRELYATQMNVMDGALDVFNNNELPARKKIRNGKYPHQLLQQLKGAITVKLLSLANVDISYAEYDRDSKEKGTITFKRTSGTITNITNVEKIKAKGPYLFAKLTTYIMGEGKLDVNFRFDLDAKDGAFSYSGALGNMDGRVLNEVTMPLGMVQVKRGMAKKLSFDIKANDQKAKGSLQFAYNDLSVALLKRDKEEDKLVRQVWMSLLANAMVINSDNPGKDGVFINAPINYQRTETASFFSFIWRTLFVGIKYSVGVTPKKEEEIYRKIQKFEQIKIDRDKRRSLKEKRRRSNDGR
ncbi:hypothetical protein [Pedobacter sp. JCM 36344]|uniref:hypothetical protein n=1 Tax=Pedobacter sp. JCM 36344 TaxID=3374280 RepID=UPI00397941C1